MLRVGLTGGIATGKTTVAAMLGELGCHVLYADQIARDLMEPGAAAYRDVVTEFGAGILDANGRVDRPKLAAIVFSDPARIARLNAIVHPRVLEALKRALAAIERAEPHAIAVIEAALLIEAEFHRHLDCLVVTWCTPEQQIARLTGPQSDRKLTPEQARQRVAAQMPLEQKRRMADEEIDCSGSLEHTREQVRAVLEKLKMMEAAVSRKRSEGDGHE